MEDVRFSAALLSVLGITVLVAQDQNANSDLSFPIDDGVRKAWKRKPAALVLGWRADSGVFDKQLGDAFELVEKARCKCTTAFAPIEPCRLGEVVFRSVVKRVCQESSARKRATTSGPETGVDSPRSISESRLAARLSQALSRALSASRLAITRSRSRSRSAAGRRRISSSKASTGNDIVESLWLVGRCPQLATSRLQ